MKFKQFYLGCLAHASYYLGSEAEAAIIDPQRDVEQYLAEAEANNQQIKYIIETHSHADFVSGHLELAARTSAEIVYGRRASTAFAARKVADGERLTVGKIELKFLETPGHTPEGITVIAQDTEDLNAPLKIFTGDTLFIGDVGRPDLIGSKGYTAREMAGFLYDSLHEKILKLADETEVYPAHGAGSLCGKNMSKETWSSLGAQRKTNYALQPMSRTEFVKLVTADQPQIPAYFAESARRNLAGSRALADLPKPQRLTDEEIESFAGVVLDVRPGAQYGARHIPNSINIGLGGQFASWAGILISIGTPIALAAESESQVDEAFMRLARVGHESVAGYVLMNEYRGATKTVEQISVAEMNDKAAGVVQFVDVRNPAEHASGHAAQTINLPLNQLPKEFDRLDPDKPTYVICQSGYRSSLATSVLENAGFKELYNVTGGTQAWIDAGFKKEVSGAETAKT